MGGIKSPVLCQAPQDRDTLADGRDRMFRQQGDLSDLKAVGERVTAPIAGQAGRAVLVVHEKFSADPVAPVPLYRAICG